MEATRGRKILNLLVTAILAGGLILSAVPAGPVSAQSRMTTQEKVSAIVSNMSPEEKVGQLFLVSFNGTDVSEYSQIHDLVLNYHIGGVLLSAANDNFNFVSDLTSSTQKMINDLQSTAWNPDAVGAGLEGATQQYIPLFVGISQEGDGTPNDQIFSDLTPLPDEMAIGATWNTSVAKNVGTVQGQELSALGFNLFIGPSLDVLDAVGMQVGEDLGVRTFGGDPYWVGVMGKAYIRGIHAGSNDRMAVIAKHFPGRGESDRPPEEEVATVQKSLEQLKQIELAPFFAVTDQADDPSEITDGLLVSHIRYQGFQGNIRATTKPVSFDGAALDAILSLSNFSSWRENGGLIVSDDLGSEAVRKFFDPTSQGFDARQIAKNAFLAGNDLLITGNLLSTGDPDTYTTLTRTLEYFTQKYREDTAFAQRVDESVTRILAVKLKMYPTFNMVTVNPTQAQLKVVGTNEQVTLDAARKGITLINPDASELDTVLPDPPQTSDRIIIIADTITQKQCSACRDQVAFSANNISEAIIRLYGPQAGQQVQNYRVFAYTYANLQALLIGGTETGNILNDLNVANWIVFAFSDLSQDQTELQLFRRVFNERPDLVRNKKIIGMAFNAPYFLDATDISKLTAYYGLYSKNGIYIDSAARIIFQEITPVGKSPVSIPGIGYDLLTITTPDPGQIIQLMLDYEVPDQGNTQTPSPEPTQTLSFKEGDTIPIRTGVIRDHNGNPVPDGTVVRFLIDTRSGSGTVEQIETQTYLGIARTTYKIPSTGLLEIRVTAEPATISQILRLDITKTGGVVTAIEPTLQTTTNADTTPTAEPTPTQVPAAPTRHSQGFLDLGDWFIVTLFGLVFSYLVYFRLAKDFSSRWGIRTAICLLCGGYLGYFGLVSGLFGATFITNLGTWSALIVFTAGLIVGAAGAFIWYLREKPGKKNGSAKSGEEKAETGQSK